MSNKMIKLLTVLLAFVLCLSVVGCTSSEKKTENTSSTPSNNETVENPDDNTDNTENPDNSDSSDDPALDEEPSDGDDYGNYGDGVEDLTPPAEDVEVQQLTVYNANPVNTNFMGINGVYQVVDGMSDSFGRVYSAAQQKEVYDRFDNMDMQVIRSFYGSSLSWNADTKTFDFTRPDMVKYMENCKELQKRGIEIGITPHWTFRNLLESNITMDSEHPNMDISNAYGIYVAGDATQTFKNLGRFMEESALTFKANGINNIKYLFCFTEINNTFYYMDKDKTEWAGKHISEVRQIDRLLPLYDQAVTEIDNALKASNLRSQYKIVGPCDNWRYDDEGGYDYSRMVKYTLEKMSDKVDIIGTHRGYATSGDYTQDSFNFIPYERHLGTYETVSAAGKDLWIDEYNVQLEGLQAVADYRASAAHPWKGSALGAMVTSVMGLGASSVFLWNAAEQQWPNHSTYNQEFDNGVQIAGFWPVLFESYTPYHAYYSSTILTKYIGRGKTFACDEGDSVYLGYIEREDGNVTLIAVNYNFEEVNLEYLFEKELEGKTLYRRLYNPTTVKPTSSAKILGVDAKAVDVTEGFYDTLPAGGVAVYTTVKD